MKNRNYTSKVAAASLALALTSFLAACGGGGGSSSPSTGSSSSSSSTSQTVTGTLSTPQYASTSAQVAAFNLLNQYRQQCGFPALQENTVLDTAAQNHAKYMGLNNTVSDTEVSGSPGYTGTTYIDRAAVPGFPSSAIGIGVSGGGDPTTANNFSASQAGPQFLYSLLGGVYHADVAAYPVATIGIGEYETQTTSGSYIFTNSWQSMSLLNTQYVKLSNGPLTFPCQGITGVPYKEIAESPTPPNVSASGWGTPVVVMGNVTDTLVLTSATMTDTSGNTISLQVLNSTTDPNKELAAFQAVAYPTSPLLPNTTYSVSVTGTVNSILFSRSFTFTTGNVIG